jgi:hypothetical protein
VNPFTGAVLTQAPKEQPLYVACSGNIHLEDPDETQASLDPHKDYYVRDNIFDPACWEAVSP